MSQIHNEQTKLLATGLNNVAVAFVVIGGVTPVTAMSFGVALDFDRGRVTLDREADPQEPSAVSSGEIFVTFVIPAVVLAMAYLAMLANERAVKRAVQREHRTPGE